MSKMSKRIMGLESEYALVGSLQESDREGLFAFFEKFCNCRIATASSGAGFFLQNGGRFYMDTGNHPEYATPECLGPRQLVSYTLAGDRLLSQVIALVKKKSKCNPKKPKPDLYRNNRDFNGNTYGCHENYLINKELFNSLTKASLEYKNNIRDFWIGYLVSSVIFTGNGNCEGILGINNSFDLLFTISQRAKFILETVSNTTTSSRPIIQTRNEPHTDKDGGDYSRLHLICRDANMSPFALYLKVGTASIILGMLEAKQFKSVPVLDKPVAALHRFSDDISLSVHIMATNGYSYSALELQRMYFKQAKEFVATYGDNEDKDVIKKWGETLDALEKIRIQPELLFGKIDWITKKIILDKIMARRGGKNPANLLNIVRAIDLQYHNIDENKGLYYQCADSQKIVSPKEIEQAIYRAPEGIRPSLRGFLIKQFARPEVADKYTFHCDWSFISFQKRNHQPNENPCVIFFKNPYKAVLQENQHLLLPFEINIPKWFIEKK